MYYLILYQDFKIEDIEIESNYGIFESGLDYLWFKSNKYETINIWMCSQTNLQKFDNPNLFIVCHLDRDECWMIRVTNIKIDNLKIKLEQKDGEIRDIYGQLITKDKEFADLCVRTDDLRVRTDDLHARTDDLHARTDDLYQKLEAYFQRTNDLEHRIDDMNNNLRAIENSKSYLIGRIITYIPRKILNSISMLKKKHTT